MANATKEIGAVLIWGVLLILPWLPALQDSINNNGGQHKAQTLLNRLEERRCEEINRKLRKDWENKHSQDQQNNYGCSDAEYPLPVDPAIIDKQGNSNQTPYTDSI